MMRILLKIFLFLIVVSTIAFFVALDRVDYAPYFESGYYQTTKTRLEKEAAGLQSAKGPVSIGFSRVNITPLPSSILPMAGYGKREGEPAKGVHDSLFVKTMILQVEETVLAIVGTDLLIVPPNVADLALQKITERTGLAGDQLFYTATHTHSSVGGWSSRWVGKAFAGEPNPEIVEWLSEKIANGVESALQDLKPGRIGSGNFKAPDLVRNRLVGELGREHNTFSFLIAEQHLGKKAVVGIFAAHATTLNDQNMDYSADYPAYWYQKLEQAGFDLPVFCAGSVGSHGPESVGKSYEKAQYLGNALADSLLVHSLSVELKDTIPLAVLDLKIELPTDQIRLIDHWSLAPFLSKKLFPPFGAVRLQSARIGNFIWTTTPADYSGELALVRQNELYNRGFQSAITSFNGAYIGYILPAKYYHLNDYESRTMSWFGPNMGPYMNELIFRMTNILAGLN